MSDNEDTPTKKRYEPLGDYLRELYPFKNDVVLTFKEVEEIINHELPESATKHHYQWWANQTRGSRAPHWIAAGFEVTKVDLPKRKVRFSRSRPNVETLNNPALQDVITKVNELAHQHPIGQLQEWRKTNLGISKQPSKDLFYSKVKDNREWVYHAGGLSELQFNIYLDEKSQGHELHHGVAFSLQTTREMPTIEPLVPKVEKFNEYLRINPGVFNGLSMWYFDDGELSIACPVSPVPDEHIKPKMFIFIGAYQSIEEVNLSRILSNFDSLLPLYKYVEGTGAFPKERDDKKGFEWTPGNRACVTQTVYKRPSKSVNKLLRHNEIQSALFDYLVSIHGEDNVSGEQGAGTGTSIDVAVRSGEQYIYYEIKTGLSAQSCIREALGQILEYSYWPGNQRAERLIVVGEAAYDHDAKAYMQLLQKEFSLPIEYKQFDMHASCFK